VALSFPLGRRILFSHAKTLYRSPARAAQKTDSDDPATQAWRGAGQETEEGCQGQQAIIVRVASEMPKGCQCDRGRVTIIAVATPWRWRIWLRQCRTIARSGDGLAPRS